jgi:hypothetical protein
LLPFISFGASRVISIQRGFPAYSRLRFACARGSVT